MTLVVAADEVSVFVFVAVSIDVIRPLLILLVALLAMGDKKLSRPFPATGFLLGYG